MSLHKIAVFLFKDVGFINTLPLILMILILVHTYATVQKATFKLLKKRGGKGRKGEGGAEPPCRV